MVVNVCCWVGFENNNLFWFFGFVMLKKGGEVWSVNIVVVGLFGLDRD